MLYDFFLYVSNSFLFLVFIYFIAFNLHLMELCSIHVPPHAILFVCLHIVLLYRRHFPELSVVRTVKPGYKNLDVRAQPDKVLTGNQHSSSILEMT